jgi:hypothetical protein
MALIKTKIGFNGPCDEKHELYQCFYNAKAFLSTPLTLYKQAVEAQNVKEHDSDDDNANANVDEDAYAMPPPPPPPVHPMQPQSEPSVGYFDSYFSNIQPSMIPNFSRCNPGSTLILRHMGNR